MHSSISFIPTTESVLFVDSEKDDNKKEGEKSPVSFATGNSLLQNSL